MSKYILVVDDEKAITSALFVLLKGAGYDVKVVHSGEAAMTQLSEKKLDLMVLDIMMPGLDGYEVCRQVRQQTAYTPILMLTARDESWEKVVGLEQGADVYMTKPFIPNELLAQVKALLRLTERTDASLQGNAQGRDERPLVCGPLTLYAQQCRAQLNGAEIELTPKEFELLYFFMKNPERVFGRQTLLCQVWEYEYPDNSRTVDTHIQRLRMKIEADPTQPQLLQTVRGFGYRLIKPEKG